MADVDSIARQLAEYLSNRYSNKKQRVHGVLGNGAGTVDIDGMPDFVYFRPVFSTRELWKVIHRNANVPRWNDFPVVVEQLEDSNDYQVISVDWNALAEQTDIALHYIKEHAQQHIINEQHIPHDPVWIYRRGIVLLRGEPADNGKLQIYVKPGDLCFRDMPYWPGGYGPELDDYKPASGYVWITHYITRDLDVDIQVSSTNASAPVSPPAGCIPICYVKLSSDATEITENDIYDARLTVAHLPAAIDVQAQHVGQVLYSVDGENFEPCTPITNTSGWIVEENYGILLVDN